MSDIRRAWLVANLSVIGAKLLQPNFLFSQSLNRAYQVSLILARTKRQEIPINF